MRFSHATHCWGALVLIAFVASCSAPREPSERSAAAPAQPSELAPSSRELLSLLPESGAVPGWSRGAEPRFFGPGNLWEYIDGAAESYVTYGFQEVVTAEYTGPDEQSQAVVDIYRMKDPRNAFGIFTQELNPESEIQRVGVEGYWGGTALNFWARPYYVKITVFQEREDLKQEMMKFAEFISGKIGTPGSEPSEVSYFPKENLVPHSVRYLAKDVLGQSYLSDAFEARYRQGSGEYKIVVISLPDSDQAREALAKYREFIASGGQVQQDLTAPADGGFAGKDSFYGSMAAVRQGNRIAVLLGGPSVEFDLSRIKATLSNIK
jgi:hypothetical protein